MAFKAPTLGVLGWPDRALRHHPVIEALATQLLRDPMQDIFINPAYATCSRGCQQLSTFRCLDTCSSTTAKHRASKTCSRLLVPHGNAWPTSRSGLYAPFEMVTPYNFGMDSSRILPTTVRPGQATVLCQEIVLLLEKGDILRKNYLPLR